MSRVIKKCLYLREVFKEFIVSYLPVQKQTSRSKCGPFSIVFSAKIFDGKFLNEGSFPVDTGRKLNVLCTFNLRPVSTEVFLEAATGAGFFAIFTGKHLLGSHFNKVAGLWACNFI